MRGGGQTFVKVGEEYLKGTEVAGRLVPHKRSRRAHQEPNNIHKVGFFGFTADFLNYINLFISFFLFTLLL